MNKQTPESLSQQLDTYSEIIRNILENYIQKKSSAIAITLDTAITDLPFSNRIKNRLRHGTNLETVRDLLLYNQHSSFKNIDRLGDKSIQTIQQFIEDNLSSLEPESITDLYYKRHLDALAISNDLDKLNNIYDSLSKYYSALSPDSEVDLSAKRDIRLLLDKVNELLNKCQFIFQHINTRIDALKIEYIKISRRSENGEFIEPIPVTTLDGVSQSNSSTELRQQFEEYKSIVDSIRAKYIGVLPINLGTNIRELHFVDSQNTNSRLINILEQYSVLADTGFSDDNYKRIFTVIDLLLLYTSNNDPIRLVCDKYICKTSTGLSRDSINQIELFIYNKLIPLLFNKDIIAKYYTKSEEHNVFFNDLNTINKIYYELLSFQRELSYHTKLNVATSNKNTYGPDILDKLTNPELRLELNKKALYWSHVKDLINDCKNLLYLLDKIKECLDMAIKPESNKAVIEHLEAIQSGNDSRTPGGECH